MFIVKFKCHIYILIGWNIKHHLELTILIDVRYLCYFGKKYKMAAAEHISYDWVKEDILIIIQSVLQIVSHDNVVFCRDICL